MSCPHQANSTWSGFGVLIATVLLLAGLWNAGLHAGRQEVIDQCANHNRYYIHESLQYMNCFVTNGPEIVPGSTAGKKK